MPSCTKSAAPDRKCSCREPPEVHRVAQSSHQKHKPWRFWQMLGVQANMCKLVLQARHVRWPWMALTSHPPNAMTPGQARQLHSQPFASSVSSGAPPLHPRSWLQPFPSLPLSTSEKIVGRLITLNGHNPRPNVTRNRPRLSDSGVLQSWIGIFLLLLVLSRLQALPVETMKWWHLDLRLLAGILYAHMHPW